jgi:predicted permease
MTRSFVNLLRVDLGFIPDHRVAVNFTLSTTRHPDNYLGVYQNILDRVRATPGVISAGAIRDLPFRGDGEGMRFRTPALASVPVADRPMAMLMFTSEGFFEAMGIPMLGGRDLSRQDRRDSPLVFVVNQAFAKKYFPNQNAVGQSLILGDTNHVPVVGVVGDVRQASVDEAPVPRVYASVYQISRVRMNLVARTREDPRLMIKRIHDAIRSVEPEQTITASFTLDEAIGRAVARPRLLVVLLGLFGAMGLILGALGIYGVLAYLVAQRTREIGVRLALGAQTGDVLRMVVGGGLRLAAIGVVIGVAGALALTRLMQGVLFGVTPTDPLTFGVVIAGLLSVAAIASLVPAVRATRVDPLIAIRAD